jgi:hypothetical protein
MSVYDYRHHGNLLSDERFGSSALVSYNPSLSNLRSTASNNPPARFLPETPATCLHTHSGSILLGASFLGVRWYQFSQTILVYTPQCGLPKQCLNGAHSTAFHFGMNDGFADAYRSANWCASSHNVRTPYNGSKNTRYQQSTHQNEKF